MGMGVIAILSSLSYSVMTLGSVIKAVFLSAGIWIWFQSGHLLKATYACPGENICSSRLTEMLFRIRLWVL